MPTSKLFRQFAAMFRPPFEGLGIVVWLYFVWCFLVHPHSMILRAEFPDPDDYTLLTHTLDWLKGQGWFDLVQHRLNPPFGVPLHYSRLTELPLAGLILPLRAAGLSWLGSATIAAAIWPLVLLAGMLAALRWVAASFLPRDWTGATAYVLLFATPLMFQFTPGHVDHHGLALLITLMALGCAVRMMQEPEALKWGVGAGLFLALGQAVALETLPWLLLLSASIGLRMMAKGRPAARSGLAFGLALYLASAFLLMATHRPEEWLAPDPLTYSIVYVLLAGSIAVCCAGVALTANSRLTSVRYGTGIGLALLAAVVFFTRFPALLAGPYGAMDKALAALMFDQIGEMLPLITSPQPLSYLLLPLLGLFASVALLPRREDKDRWPLHLLPLLLLTAALALALFYQKRFGRYAVLFSVIPLTAFLRQSLAWAAACWRGRRLALTEIGLLLLVGPLPGVLLPAVVDGRPFNTGVLLFPVNVAERNSDMTSLEAALNNPLLYGRRQHLILNPINEGPELLFRTRHKVLAAPYHTNVTGFLDSVRFFTAHDPAEAKKIALDRGASLVVLKKPLAAIYRTNPEKAPAEGGTTPTGPADAIFAETLVKGQTPPWLKPVELVPGSPFLLFEVKP